MNLFKKIIIGFIIALSGVLAGSYINILPAYGSVQNEVSNVKNKQDDICDKIGIIVKTQSQIIINHNELRNEVNNVVSMQEKTLNKYNQIHAEIKEINAQIAESKIQNAVMSVEVENVSKIVDQINTKLNQVFDYE